MSEWLRGRVLESQTTMITKEFLLLNAEIFNANIENTLSDYRPQGNAFACVCHSVNRGSLYDITSFLVAWSHVLSGKISVPGPMFHP